MGFLGGLGDAVRGGAPGGLSGSTAQRWLDSIYPGRDDNDDDRVSENDHSDRAGDGGGVDAGEVSGLVGR